MNPFSQKAVVGMIAVGLVTFILGLLLAGFGQDLFGKTSAGANTFSRSLVGHRAFAELLRQSGLPVVLSRNADSSSANEAFPLLLLEPMDIIRDKYTSDAADGLADKYQQGQYGERILPVLSSGAGVVLALPKRWASVSEMAAGWIGSEELMSPAVVQRMLSDALLGAGCISEQLSSNSIKRVSSTEGFCAKALGLSDVQVEADGPMQVLGDLPESTPLVFSDHGVVISSLNCGLVLVSDPDLFNNRSLARADNAAIMLALLTDYLGAQGVVVDETFHGFKSQKNLLAHAMGFPLILVSIHFLLTMLMAFWALSAYFGKPLLAPSSLSSGKGLLIDNTANLLFEGGDKADALRRYSSVVMARVARHFGTGPGLKSLQELSESRGIRVNLKQLMSRSGAVNLTQAEALSLARQFHHWALAVQGYCDPDTKEQEKKERI